jgi:hypothetical protein
MVLLMRGGAQAFENARVDSPLTLDSPRFNVNGEVRV